MPDTEGEGSKLTIQQPVSLNMERPSETWPLDAYDSQAFPLLALTVREGDKIARIESEDHYCRAHSNNCTCNDELSNQHFLLKVAEALIDRLTFQHETTLTAADRGNVHIYRNEVQAWMEIYFKKDMDALKDKAVEHLDAMRVKHPTSQPSSSTDDLSCEDKELGTEDEILAAFHLF